MEEGRNLTRGVQPALSLVLGFAPSTRRVFTSSTFPYR